MEERTQIIQDLDEARTEIRAVLAGIDPQQKIYPGWTMKHLLAHMIGWDEATAAALRAHAGGDEPGTPAVRGIDFYNAESVATRENLSYDQVSREWDLARDELKTVLHEMPADKFKERLVFPWGSSGTVAQLIAIFVEHEREHATEIEGIGAKPASA
jgi:hypothetical protein